jgi:MgtC family
MFSNLGPILIHLLAAAVAGGCIGLERSFHGRPAGFRTHTLVCVASSLLMLVTLYQWQWLPGVPLETIRTDPTRMAQGIMTGIGFLGAGVIFKEGLSVRGLTTAASIWTTAAIGILMGIGLRALFCDTKPIQVGFPGQCPVKLERRQKKWPPGDSANSSGPHDRWAAASARRKRKPAPTAKKRSRSESPMW